MNIVRLKTCMTSFEANLMRGNLQNEGIDCFVTNEHFSGLMPHYFSLMGSGVHVMVKENDLKKALGILEISPIEVICPHCDSKNIKTKLGLKKKLTILLSLIVWVPFNNIQKNYYCKDCQSEFE